MVHNIVHFEVPADDVERAKKFYQELFGWKIEPAQGGYNLITVGEPGPDGGMPNVFLGEGICGWTRQLQALKDDGYEGFISLETHVNPERFVLRLPSQMDLPACLAGRGKCIPDANESLRQRPP